MDYPQSEAWERQVAAKVMSVFAPLRAARTIDDVDRGTVNLQANLEAAQRSFLRISDLSLFNLL